MNTRLAAWNAASEAAALDAMIACCGSRRWAAEMVARRPIDSPGDLGATADQIWSTMKESDWMQAILCHPRIGEGKARHATEKSREWSQKEQSLALNADNDILKLLATGNEIYEMRFGFTYIVCATGKTAAEMLAILERRLKSDRDTELREAAEQQRQIMQIRLRKWLEE